MPGPTHITLDWQNPAEGWITSYKINVVPTKTSNKTRRSERADNLTTSHLFVSQNGSVDYEPREIEFNIRGCVSRKGIVARRKKCQLLYYMLLY